VGSSPTAPRHNVFKRDGYQCMHCGKRPKELTIDHVLPQSRGGPDAWDNVVACCRPCNHRKGARTPEEARMPSIGRRLSRASPATCICWGSTPGPSGCRFCRAPRPADVCHAKLQELERLYARQARCRVACVGRSRTCTDPGRGRRSRATTRREAELHRHTLAIDGDQPLCHRPAQVAVG
jgi:hypothetical protein